MKNSKFSEVQIIKILSEQNQGKTGVSRRNGKYSTLRIESIK